jgi:uncharacterized membrane protein YhaH (DUF805 family)
MGLKGYSGEVEEGKMNYLLGSPLVMLVLVLAIVVFPTWRIISRTGRSGWWCLLMFIPLVNIVGLWILAFVDWPAIDRKA